MKERLYRLYGLSVRSSFELGAPRARGLPDVELVAAEVRPRGEGHGDRSWFSCRRLEDGGFYLRWRGLFEFLVAADGRRIQCHRLPRASDEAFRAYLLSQVLSFALLARGREPLHGSAVAVGGNVVAFLGDCGLGKSSLAAEFLRAGFPLVTDDLLVLSESRRGYEVEPGVPRIKLFPRMAQHLLGWRAGAPRMNPGTAKMVLPVPPGRVVRRPLPLHTLYVLDRSSAIEIAPLTGAGAFLRLLGATFNTIWVDPERLARQFAFAHRLASTARIRRLAYPRRLAAIGAVRDAVVADLSAVRRDLGHDRLRHTALA